MCHKSTVNSTSQLLLIKVHVVDLTKFFADRFQRTNAFESIAFGDLQTKLIILANFGQNVLEVIFPGHVCNPFDQLAADSLAVKIGVDVIRVLRRYLLREGNPLGRRAEPDSA